jgi:hypothetical protein
MELAGKLVKFSKASLLQKPVAPGNSGILLRILKFTLSQKPNSSIFVACFERNGSAALRLSSPTCPLERKL